MENNSKKEDQKSTIENKESKKVSVLDFIRKNQPVAMSFASHPAKSLEQDQKSLYLKVLSLVMNVDEEIAISELDYFTTVTVSLGFQVSEVETFKRFSLEPDPEIFYEAMAFLENSELKYTFLLDCIVIINADGTKNENENELLERFCTILHIDKIEYDNLNYVYKLFQTKDENGIANLLFKNNNGIDKKLFSYIGEYYTIDTVKINAYYKELIQKRIPNTLVIITFEKNTYSSDNMTSYSVTSQRIKNTLFIEYLNSEIVDGEIKFENENLVTDLSSNPIIDLSVNSINYSSGQFICDQENDVIGVSPYGVESFLVWLNKFSDIKFNICQLPLYREYMKFESGVIESELFSKDGQYYKSGNYSFSNTPHSFHEPELLGKFTCDKQLKFRLMVHESEKKK